MQDLFIKIWVKTYGIIKKYILNFLFKNNLEILSLKLISS